MVASADPNNLEILTFAASDVSDALRLAECANAQQVLPVLDAEGQQSMRMATIAQVHKLADTRQFPALKAVMDTVLVGYVAWRSGGHVTQLYVAPEHQHLGLGTVLMESVLSAIPDRPVTLRASVNAVGFYLRFGFVATGPECTDKGIRYVPMHFQGQASR